ncbi:response regulator [Reyranella sp.]|uniref:response regulator n=1 Tax=Reyranella sp. TaxID=1929291 RepID=UPI003F731009
MSSVLLAEDEFLIRAVLVDSLADVGIECIEAATGQEAIDVVRGDKPLVAVIVDIGLPDMSGEKVIEAVAQHRPGVPIIRCSGASAPSSLPSGIKMYSFPKPYSASELSNFVASLVRKG